MIRPLPTDDDFSIVEASITDLSQLLQQNRITAVELLTKYLLRINHYDNRGICLNSIPILNPDSFDEAAASDRRRARGAPLGPLDGIPYTLKDSMMYKGMTCSNGSPAFRNLVATRDSFVAEQLRKAGAVCVGRTNQPPQMASGMHRGLHGRAESPYSADYLTAAFSSGSSNGSATSTAASFAVFGLGTETVSSGRSPASNNGLVAYTPSRNVISGRGIWPLYATCDVVVPHTRTVDDMLAILDVLTVKDEQGEGEFWEKQKFVAIEGIDRPACHGSLSEDSASFLRGKTVAVPSMYIGGTDPKAKPTVVSQDSIDLFHRARVDLERLGAKVVVVDSFPLVGNYEDDSVSGHVNNVVGFTPDWNSKERGELVAYIWDDFLKANNDPYIPNLASVDGTQIFPDRPKDYPPDKWIETKNFMNYPRLIDLAKSRQGRSIWDIPGIDVALPALEAQRKRDLEDWMDEHRIDVVVFPANGDVGASDVDTNDASALHALQNGVKYSHANRALRHLGCPSVSVTMGLMPSKHMPMNLTFVGKHGQDADLLRYTHAYEGQSRRRVAPPRTPALASDVILGRQRAKSVEAELSLIDVEATIDGENRVRVVGFVNESAQVEVYIDGQAQRIVSAKGSEKWQVETVVESFEVPTPPYGGMGEIMDKIMVVILAKTEHGMTAGKLILLRGKVTDREQNGRQVEA